MSIFSLFRGSPEKQLLKLRKKTKEPHGDASVRINAAYKLYEIGTPEAIHVTWSCHREIITDQAALPEDWETPPSA